MFRSNSLFSFQFDVVRAFAVCALLLLTACASGPTPTGLAPDTGDFEYRLGAGDKVEINVFGDESLSGEQGIDGQGTLSMPLIGTVSAKGLTASELETELQDQYREYMRDPNVTVRVTDYRPFYIVGEVRRPGSYAFVDGMTVVNAVALAGGYTYRASKDGYVIQRNNEALLARDLTPVLPGDVLTIRERYF